MFTAGNRFFIKTTLLLLLCFLPACDRNGPPEKKPVGLLFHESSNGLPSSGLWRNGLSLYDLNGDGLMDIVAPPARKAIEKDNIPFAWQQKIDGSWREMRLEVPTGIPYGYGDISVNDFNVDGIPDLALAMHMCPLTLLLGTPDGKYTNAPKGLPLRNALTSRALGSADLNHDGRPDIIACSEADFGRKGYVAKGVWACVQSIAGWSCDPIGREDVVRNLFSDQVLIGDVNGDGNKDIAVASLVVSRNEIIWIGDGKGGFEPFNQGLPREKIYLNIALADINRDGRDDLIASISGFRNDSPLGPRVFLSGTEGFTELSRGLPENEHLAAVAAGDLDGDGDIEIIGATGKGGITIYSQEDNLWKKQVVSGLPADSGRVRIYSIYCMDVNNDGKKDIIFNHASEVYETGGIRVFLNQSQG